MTTVSVTMRQKRLGEDGQFWLPGETHVASEAFAAMLISCNLADGVLPQPPTRLQVNIDANGNTFAVGLNGEQIGVGSPVTVVGVRAVGQVLSMQLTAGWAYTSVQWKRSVNGVVSNIAGQTGSTYTQVSADVAAGAYAFPALSGLIYSAPGTASAPVPPPAPVAPGAPTSVVATAGDGTVSLAFTPGSTGGSAILEHEALLSNSESATGASSPISVASANGAAVTGRVRSRNVVGWGPYSDPPSNSVTPSAAPAPTVYGASDTLRITASSRVRLGAGRIVSLENDGPNSADVTLYDDHTATGRVVYAGTIAAGTTTTLNERVVLGAYLALVGTTPAVIITTDEG